jgi:hypothetical protein
LAHDLPVGTQKGIISENSKQKLGVFCCFSLVIYESVYILEEMFYTNSIMIEKREQYEKSFQPASDAADGAEPDASVCFACKSSGGA